MKTSVYPLLLLSALINLSTEYEARSVTASDGTSTTFECPVEDICTVASRCCVEAMDSYGWIAAAVGWSLLFLSLIVMCIGKVMNLTPNEPKYMEA